MTKIKVKFYFYQHYFLTHPPTPSLKSGKGSGHFPVSSNAMGVKISPLGEGWGEGHQWSLTMIYKKMNGSEY